MNKRILLGYDGSESSQQALRPDGRDLDRVFLHPGDHT
jgi:hypothetical protein